MLVLLVCIFCNVLLAIIFKTFDKYRIDNLNAIIINYFVCVLFASALLGESAIPFDLFDRPWWPLSFTLSVLFIFGFNIMALSFQKSGVALTAIVQKMSLIIPAAVAISLYSEPLGMLKAIGIVFALLAIIFVNLPSSNGQEKLNLFHPLIIYPLLTFLLSGIIEVVLFLGEAEGLVGQDGIMFTATAFGGAAVLGITYRIYTNLQGKGRPRLKELMGGIALGLPNYLTIYLLVYLLSKGWQGSVLFPVNSIGILILTSIAGFVMYKERLERNKIIGILLGTMAIVLISQA